MHAALTLLHHRFLFSGLVSLMDTMLCAAVRRVRAINAQGVTKMIRNILALQQNLRNIVIADTSALTSLEQSRTKLEANREAIGADTERWNNFDRSRHLWELLTKEPGVRPSTCSSDARTDDVTLLRRRCSRRSAPRQRPRRPRSTSTARH
jgi:hypothetical protein